MPNYKYLNHTAEEIDESIDTITGHVANADLHVTAAEKTSWNGKADSTDVYPRSQVDNLMARKVDKVDGKQLSTEDYTSEEKQKLASLENYDDSAVQAALSGKVDKVSGKQLSTEDYTTAEKQKLSGLSNYDDTAIQQAIAGKQDALTFDAAPTANSDNPVKSGGVKTYVDTAVTGKASISDVYGLGTAIESGADLNSLTTAGLYTCATVTIANTLSNAPITGSAFRLEVKYLNSSTRIRQECYILSDTSTYYARTYTSTGWGAWVLFQNPKEAAFGQGSTITATSESHYDLNELQAVGRYSYGASAAPNLDNMPSGILTTVGGEIIVEAVQLSNRLRQTIYLNSRDNAGKFWVRHAYSGTAPNLNWSNWFLFEGTEIV